MSLPFAAVLSRLCRSTWRLALFITAIAGAAYGQNLAFNPGMASDFAGTGSVSYSSATFVGPASTVALNFPRRVAVDGNGNVFLIEKGGQIARVIASGRGAIPSLPTVAAPVAGTVYTVTGNGSNTACSGKTDGFGDGCPATQAYLSAPYGIALDAHGNLYLGDSSNNLIRVVYAGGTVPNLPNNPVVGNIYAVAGTGTSGSGGDAGPALSAQIGSSHGLSVDSHGNIFFADSGNQSIRVVYAGGTIPGIPNPTVGSMYTLTASPATACAAATSACGDGGPAISAQINGPDSTAVDSFGNIYFSDTSDLRVRVIYVAGTLPGISSPVVGNIYTVAGDGVSGAGGDGGKATAASLTSGIGQVAVDAVGNLYIPDGTSNTVRKVDPSGIITTVFGGAATVCAAHTDAVGDGCASNATTLQSDSGVALDAAGNLYIADYKNNLIRLLTPTASALSFTGAIGSNFASQNVIVSNAGAQPLRLSGIAVTGPFVQATSGGPACNASTTLASGASCQIAINVAASQVGSFSGPVAVSSNALNAIGGQSVIALTSAITQGATTTVLNISPVLANVGQPVTMTATVNAPAGVSLNPTGTVTFLNGSTMLGSASPNGGVASFTTSSLAAGTYTITAAYGGDSSFTASVSAAVGLKVSSTPVPSVTLSTSATAANVGQSLTFTATVLPYSGTQIPTGSVTFQDGANLLGTQSLSGTGSATVSISSLPAGLNPLFVSYSGDSTYVANTSTTVPVIVSTGVQLTFIPGKITTVAGSHTLGAGFSGDGTAATAGQLKTPLGLTQDSAGNIYIADSANNRIRKINAQTGFISTVVGTGTACSAAVKPCGDGGPAGSALLNDPEAVRVDSAGNLYIDDRKDNAIRKVSIQNGNITTVAGTLTVAGAAGDGGLATSATLNGPRGLYLDNAGNLYIADSGNALVRKVDALTGIINTIAGSGASLGDGGAATSAQLVNPRGLFLDNAANLYVADIGAYRVRKVDAISGVITTVAGTGLSCTTPPCGDGTAATSAGLGGPEDVVADSAGNLYLTDPNINAVRKVDTNGVITTIAGEQSTTAGYGADGGPATGILLSYPNSLLLDAQGDLYVSEANNSLVREISAGTAVMGFGSLNLGATASQFVTVNNTGKQPLALTGLSIANEFTQQPSSNDCSASTVLSVGSACELDLQFSPITAGSTSGSVNIADNSGNAVSGQNVISVTGLGVASNGTTSQSITFSALPGTVYGVAPITLAATASSGLAVTYNTVTGPATISGSTLRITGVGTVTVTAYQFGNATYAAATPVMQSFHVAPAVLTVTATDATRANLAANPAFTYTVVGFVNGDTSVVVTGTPQITTTALTSSAAGMYPITITAGTLAAANYTFNFVDGILTVAGASQSITFNSLSNVVYGTTPIALSATASSGLPVSYSIASGPATIAGSMLSITGTGTVSMTASQSGNGSYAAAAPVTQSFSVAPAVLTVTASNTSRVIGAANPAFTDSIAGFVNGDTQTVVQGTPSFSTTATMSSPVGSYPIVITAGTLSAANYTFTFINGTLAVQPLPPDFTVASNLPALTLEPGVTGHLTLTLTPVSNYQGSVTFTCAGLPAGVNCIFTPATLIIDGSGAPVQEALAVDTSGFHAALAKPAEQSTYAVTLAGVCYLPGGMAALFLLLRRKRVNANLSRCCAWAFVLLIGLMALTGCGAGKSYVPPAVTTVTITATGSSGGVVHAFNLQLTVL